MAFMQPEYYVGKYSVVSNKYCDTAIIPEDVCYSDDPQDYKDYLEFSHPTSVEHYEGFLTRLSASGYMDCTDWIACTSMEEARSYWREIEEIDPDTGDSLDDEE